MSRLFRLDTNMDKLLFRAYQSYRIRFTLRPIAMSSFFKEGARLQAVRDWKPGGSPTDAGVLDRSDRASRTRKAMTLQFGWLDERDWEVQGSSALAAPQGFEPR